MLPSLVQGLQEMCQGKVEAGFRPAANCVQDFDISLCDALNSSVKNVVDHKGGDIHDACSRWYYDYRWEPVMDTEIVMLNSGK